MCCAYRGCLACGRECVQLLKELGRVEYIALTTHAYEHKLFVAPFSRKFPDAKVPIVMKTPPGVI